MIETYAQQVVDGAVPASREHRQACARHLRDLARQGSQGFPYRFDEARARRLFEFAEKLRHYKGEWAGQPIRLEPWQRFMLGSVVGWVHQDTGRRRFRTAFNQVPRKNGKTLLAAVVLLYVTFFDGEAGAEGYSVATKRDQAKLVFEDAKKMVLSSGLKTRIKTLVGNMHAEATWSKLEPLGADHDSTDGLNPHVVVVDEMHAMKDRGMLDVIETATGARAQPLIYQITTAGDTPLSPWGDQQEYARHVLDQTLTDETFFVFMTGADPEDDWQDPATWRKANPNFGISVSVADLEAKCAKAKGIPAAAAAFQQKHLNRPGHGSAPCLSVDGWRKGQSVGVTREAFEAALEHEPCWLGLDLSAKIDLTVVSLLFPPRPGRERWALIQRIWTPADTLADRAHHDRVPYAQWVAEGWLRTMPGTAIDQSVVRAEILALRARYDIERIGFDAWHADQLTQQLVAEDGFAETQVVEVRQTYQGMSSACLRWQAEILAGHVDACGCPVTAWSVANTVGQRDGKGNLMFTKGKSQGRIDPVIAPTIALAHWLRMPVEASSDVLAEWI